MTDITATMYTLGQIARAIWPAGDMPEPILDVMLARPASGLALAIKHNAASKADAEALAGLMDKLSADLSDPAGGVSQEDQGPFWTGYYHYLAALDRAKQWGPEQLERAGRLLCGDRWQSDLARALGVGDRRVREWMAGDRRVPPGVWVDIAALMRERGGAIQDALRDMER